MMNSLLDRLFSGKAPVSPLIPGVYHSMKAEEGADPYRLHLRIEADESAILIVNAATVLHLNPTAAVYALAMVEGKDTDDAVKMVVDRYRVSQKQAREDFLSLREQILTVATAPDIDPVLFFNLDRTAPHSVTPSAPYRVDLALTYRLDDSGSVDPLASKRVDRELQPEEWKPILSKLWDVGVPHVTFTGGEATLLPFLPELIAHAEELGQVTGLLTNGARFTDPAYLEKLEQSGLDHILLTWNGEAADFDTKLTRALGTAIYTAVHLTLTADNLDAASAMLLQCKSAGVPAVSLSIAERSEALQTALDGLRQKAAELDLDLIWDLPAPYSASNPVSLELEEEPQGAGQTWLYVEPDGDVLPAQGINQVLGNLLRDSWQSVWENARAYRA